MIQFDTSVKHIYEIIRFLPGFFGFLVQHLYGRGTLVLGFETSLNCPSKSSESEAHVGAHVFKVLEACLFITTPRARAHSCGAQKKASQDPRKAPQDPCKAP